MRVVLLKAEIVGTTHLYKVEGIRSNRKVTPLAV
jgi:hypothetical protein